jgi:hypothetical protein
MDVWNHHLKDFEVAAFGRLVQAISSIEKTAVVRE